jgi:branched-chain amino acid transport system ATP-binding protein
VLELRSVCTRYGPVQVLWDVTLAVHAGELVCLLGGNASGKSTTMKTIMGMIHPFQGKVLFQGKPIHHLTPAEVVKTGIAPVLESRRIFPDLTVYENLLMGAYTRSDNEEIKADIAKIYAQFPVLFDRRKQMGGTLSGGEQQMLAMARALLARPQVMVMDEPSMGLSPVFVDKTFELIQDLNRRGIAILLVEQNANMALAVADRGYVLQNGHIVLHDTAENLVHNPMMRKAYLEL